MDGPNVNWKFMRPLEEKLSSTSDDYPPFLDLGSCGLHVVHGAFNYGHTKAGWDLASAFNNAYWLFLNSPVRRSAFTALTGKTTFPQKFCKTRWVKNIGPATTFLSIFQQLEAFSKSDGKRKKQLKSWLLRTVMERFVKPGVLREAISPMKLLVIELVDEKSELVTKNLKKLENFGYGFAVEQELGSLKANKKLSITELQFLQ